MKSKQPASKRHGVRRKALVAAGDRDRLALIARTIERASFNLKIVARAIRAIAAAQQGPTN